MVIGGIIGPVLISKFILREPKDVNLSSPHELTSWAWIVPICSLLIIVGLLFEEFILGKNELGLLKSQTKEEKGAVDETSKLVDKPSRRRSSMAEINQVLTRKYEVNRRISSEPNGMCNPVDTPWERKVRDELMKDKKEWDAIAEDSELMDESIGRY